MMNETFAIRLARMLIVSPIIMSFEWLKKLFGTKKVEATPAAAPEIAPEPAAQEMTETAEEEAETPAEETPAEEEVK